MMIKKLSCLALVLVTIPAVLNSFAPSNFFQSYDSALRSTVKKDGNFNLGCSFEYGSSSSGRNWRGKSSNVLALHNELESTMRMWENPTEIVANSLDRNRFAQFIRANLFGDEVGNRGKIKFEGDYKEWNMIFSGSYKFPFELIPGSLSLSVHVPVLHKKVGNFKSTDLTTDGLEVIEVEDRRIVDDVTSNFKEVVKSLGGPEYENWSSSGVGDIVAALNWENTYRQDKEYLKSVLLHGKLGVSLPTSEERDEDKAFSMSLGNDGAWGMPVGIGMQLNFVKKIQAGIDVDFLILFDKTRTRRLKTHEKQTEFMLLNKGLATKEHGLTWKFHLHLDWSHFFRGLSVGAAYQFTKHDDDSLNPSDNNFNFRIVNSANSLKEWNTHNLIFKTSYDFTLTKDNFRVSPRIGLFYKLPVSSKNVINNHTFGGQLSFNF